MNDVIHAVHSHISGVTPLCPDQQPFLSTHGIANGNSSGTRACAASFATTNIHT
jgi:hypothetical protein